EALPRREVTREHLEFAMPTAARIPAEGKARLPLRTRRDNGRVEWLLHGSRVHGGHCQQSHDRYHEDFHNDTSLVLSRVLPAGHISRQSAYTGTPYDFRTTPAAAAESAHPLWPVSAEIFVGAERGGPAAPTGGTAATERTTVPKTACHWTGPWPHPLTGRIVRLETICQMI